MKNAEKRQIEDTYKTNVANQKEPRHWNEPKGHKTKEANYAKTN